ncbi:DNA alkylation repair protein [Candidatus Woesearchaeota archaeon]|nr:DNA alkylation repair protein [Candidatus Woesearchaeota archaeon]
MGVEEIRSELRAASSVEDARNYARFFKTGKGEYGEGDIFIGVRVPVQRRLSKKYWDISLGDVEILLKSGVHEERLTAAFILCLKFAKGDDAVRRSVFDLYVRNFDCVNNWDLVDCSAHKIVGAFLKDRDREFLYELAHSSVLWERRISIISTFAYIPDGDFSDALLLAELLLKDEHDLIHKAVGWVLREVGKKDETVLEEFLMKHSTNMPRTMLRYAIEKFEEEKRQFYLKR